MANPVEVTKDVGAAKDLRYGVTTITVNTATVIAPKVLGLRHGVLLRTPGTADPTPNTEPVWIGDSKVTIATGFPMLPGSSLSIDIDDLDELYGISNTANQVVQYIGV